MTASWILRRSSHVDRSQMWRFGHHSRPLGKMGQRERSLATEDQDFYDSASQHLQIESYAQRTGTISPTHAHTSPACEKSSSFPTRTPPAHEPTKPCRVTATPWSACHFHTTLIV